jgi:hypothetical protein
MAQNNKDPKAQDDKDPKAQDDKDPKAQDGTETGTTPAGPAKFKAMKKHYFAQEEFEGNVGLAVVKIKKDAEIKDEHLALTLIQQDLPIRVDEREIELFVTKPNKYDEVLVEVA